MLTDGKAEHDEAAMWRCAPTDANMEFLPCSARSAVQTIIFKAPMLFIFRWNSPLDIFTGCRFSLSGSQRSKFIPHLLSHCARLNVQVYRPFAPGTGVGDAPLLGVRAPE